MMSGASYKGRSAAAVAILSAAIVGGPLAGGGAPVWARFGLEAAMAAVVTIWAFSGARPAAFLLLPIVAGAIAMLQAAPLPLGPISVDPNATAVAACRLFLGVATIGAVTGLAADIRGRWNLVAAMAIAGLLVWIVPFAFPKESREAIIERAPQPVDLAELNKTRVHPPVQTSGVGLIESVEVGGRRCEILAAHRGDICGSYFCSNHFAGALCLALPALLAAWLALSAKRATLVARYGIAAAILIAALATAWWFAESRAGTAATLLGSLVFFSIVIETAWVQRIVVIMTALVTAAISAFVVMHYGQQWEPIRALTDHMPQAVTVMAREGRDVPARQAFRMFLDAPLFGHGLDTYGDLIRSYLGENLVYFFAHNDYAQFLAETGLVGLAGLTILLFLLVLQARRCHALIGPKTRLLSAVAWAALAGIATHSMFDWNLHVPANSLLATVAAGLALASGSRPNPRSESSSQVRSGMIITLAMVLGACCIVATGILGRAALSETAQRQIRESLAAALLAQKGQNDTFAPAELAAGIAFAERMATWDPRNAELAVLIGQAYLRLAASIQSTADPSGHLTAANYWFEKGLANCPVTIGLPQPPN